MNTCNCNFYLCFPYTKKIYFPLHAWPEVNDSSLCLVIGLDIVACKYNDLFYIVTVINIHILLYIDCIFLRVVYLKGLFKFTVFQKMKNCTHVVLDLNDISSNLQ